VNLWRNSLIIWSEHPWIGTGAGDFEIDNRRLANEGISLSKTVVPYAHAHNVFFDALATTGILGLVALVGALFVALLVYFFRRWNLNGTPWEKFHALGGVLAITSFAIFGMSEGWMGRNAFVNQYVVIIAVLASGLFLLQKQSAQLIESSPQ
jgi:O-antigen ligase